MLTIEQGKLMPEVIFTDRPLLNETNNLHGSFFKESDNIGRVRCAAVLSYEQICKKHNLNCTQFFKLAKQIHKTKVLNALFNWPDGPRYDILLYLVANCG